MAAIPTTWDTTITIYPGEILTVTADSGTTGSLTRLADQPGGSPEYTGTSISASSSLTAGPFESVRRYKMTHTTGELTYTVTKASESDINHTVDEYLVDGAITIKTGVGILTKATAGAYTLAAPTNEDGVELTLVAGTAAAHVVTATGLINDGVTGGAKDTATFGAFVGAAITLVSWNDEWHVKSKNVVTIA